MFEDFMKNATIPGAFTNAVLTAQQSALAEKRRRAGYKHDETPAPHRRSALHVVRYWVFSILTRASRETNQLNRTEGLGDPKASRCSQSKT